MAAFSIALSALSADSTAIDVVGNNLANLNTTGYKDTSVNFQDLMAQSMGDSQVGMGIGQVGTTTGYTQGTLQTTGGPTDAAIQGNGFFVVTNAQNQTLYTRDGSFQVNAAGDLVTESGQNVQGWSAVNGTVNPNGPVGNLAVPLGTVIPAVPSSAMSLNVNLNSQSTKGTSFSAPIQVIDSQGTNHTLTVDFTNTGTNTWSYNVTIPAADLQTGGSATLATGTMTFDANGNLEPPAGTAAGAAPAPQTVAITGLADGAAPMSIAWSQFNSTGNALITQNSQASAVGSTSQNGTAAGEVTSVSLQNGGIVTANYSNGQQVTVGQVALASIPNPQSLSSVGDNNLQASTSTGTISVCAANSGGCGQIVAGSLESSTVNMATEFTNLLTYQNSYQAASKVITTTDQLLQDTIGLIPNA
jgi:flagellar hook protein FlgE